MGLINMKGTTESQKLMAAAPSLFGLQIVPEDMIIFCADQFGPDEENSFRNILNAGNEFKEAGLTPVFLCSETLKDLFVTTKEKIQKKLH